MGRVQEATRELREIDEFENELRGHIIDEIPKWVGYIRAGAITICDRRKEEDRTKPR